ncbi:MAG TPA: lysozyme inhibitor LprI family protein [Pseudolabrys sp.]|nr:lysozyme inhibitor LprI family protein [Pseudolabrys sp.]
MRKAFAFVLSMLLAPPALAQDKPAARDSAAIQKCIETRGGEKWESCIGLISKPCMDRPQTRSPADVVACLSREQTVWNNILNETHRRLRVKLYDEQQVKLRDMQRARIVAREKTCAFYWDYFQGSMAVPMSASCDNREIGRRALFLLGFLNDAEGK